MDLLLDLGYVFEANCLNMLHLSQGLWQLKIIKLWLNFLPQWYNCLLFILVWITWQRNRYIFLQDLKLTCMEWSTNRTSRTRIFFKKALCFMYISMEPACRTRQTFPVSKLIALCYIPVSNKIITMQMSFTCFWIHINGNLH